MITGFNTDVEHAGKKFHVQTQEQGLSNPVVETLVYSGGQIVTLVTNSYADIVESNTFGARSRTRACASTRLPAKPSTSIPATPCSILVMPSRTSL